MSVLGDYIRRKRGDRPQEAIGKISGITGAALSRIESGERLDLKVSTLLGLAKALNVPAGSLILAYQGIDPDDRDQVSAKDAEDIDAITQEAISEFIQWRKSKKSI